MKRPRRPKGAGGAGTVACVGLGLPKLMETAGRPMRRHRICWGWKGFLLLVPSLQRAQSQGGRAPDAR